MPGDIMHTDVPPVRDFHGILTRAPEMEPVLRLIGRAARADCTVLVQGETGTGKELAARAIHALSPRSSGPFLARNCATLSPTLLESELFGHVRGAFTGAIREKKGVFALAHCGTLLLDEIAEASPEIQGRLLRVLQEKTFVPVGETKSRTVDVRLISATNKPIKAEVAAGNFREDLSFRIRVVPVVMPPLRERTGDAEALFLHYVAAQNAASSLRSVEQVSDAALEAVRAYPWPGNVRELQSAVEYAFVVGEGPVLRLDDVPPELRGEPPVEPTSSTADAVPGAMRQDDVVAALEKHHWRRTAAAAELGVSRSTLWRAMRELGLGPDPRSRKVLQ
jgi:two-component system response regulator AtoC